MLQSRVLIDVPSIPGYAVDRPALLERLDGLLAHRLTLLVAPAGSGKSVVLSQWAIARPEVHIVWLSISPADDDAVHFATRLIGALAQFSPDLVTLAEYVPASGEGLGHRFLEALARELADLAKLAIVVDDLHRLSNRVLLDDLGELVDLIPDSVSMVLSTRTDPPILFGGQRLRRSALEFRQADLVFGDVDAAQLVCGIAGRDIDDEVVAALVGRTEGWVAGLQLAGVTLRRHDDPGEFVAGFSGADRLVADYLSGEVLAAQSERQREFLLQISVLDEVCASLAEHLTGDPTGQTSLERIESESLFLLPLDAGREWFRFHHLFRDLLRYRLRSVDPGAEARLLNKAAQWHLDRGDIAPGVEYLLRAGSFDEALDIILASGVGVYERGEMATMIRWLHQVPDARRSSRTDVEILLGLLLCADGQAAPADDTLRRVVVDPRSSAGERACAEGVRSALTQWRFRPGESLATAVRALDALASVHPDELPSVLNLTDRDSLETVALIGAARAEFLAGEFDEARRWIARALDSPGIAYSVWRVSAVGALALIEAWSGRLAEGELLATQALDVAAETTLLSHPATADAYLARALIFLERSEPERSHLSLHEAVLRGERNRRPMVLWVCHMVRSLLAVAEHRTEDAIVSLEDTEGTRNAPPPPVVDARLRALRARLLRAAAPSTALPPATPRVDPADPPPVIREAVATALSVGDVDTAAKLLDSFERPEPALRPKVTVELLVLDSLLADARGDGETARRVLSDALRAAEPNRLIQVFIDSGPTILQLCGELPASTPLVHEVLTRARATVPPVATANDLIDPLTERELEILAYFPTRMSNVEIAAELYISINTLKSHLRHIYSKLAVANRNEAIDTARTLGLLRPV